MSATIPYHHLKLRALQSIEAFKDAENDLRKLAYKGGDNPSVRNAVRQYELRKSIASELVGKANAEKPAGEPEIKFPE